MNNIRKYLLLIFIILSIPIFAVKRPEKAKNGVWDISKWNFKKNGTLNVKGEWEFYHKKFLMPDEIDSYSPDTYVDEIGFFGKNIFKNIKINGETISKKGYATYRMKIKYKDSGEKMAIKLFDIASSYELFLNGEIIASSGLVGKTLESSVGQYQPKIVHVKASKHMELVLHISTYHQFLSYLNNTIKIGLDEQIHLFEEKINFEDVFSFGVLFVLSLYYLVIHLFYDKDKDNKSSFYFSIMCLVMSVRILFSGYRYILLLFPEMPLNLLLTVNYLTYYQGFVVFSLMVASVFPKEFSKDILKIIISFSLIASIIVIMTPPRIFTYTLPFFQLFTIILFPYVLNVLFRAVKRKRDGANIFLFGMSIYTIFVINDLLYTNGLIDTTLLTNYGLFIFIFSNSLVVTKKYLDFIIATSMRMAQEELEKKRITGIFEKYVPSEVVTDLVNSDLESELGGQAREISILFTDIENFTTFAEKYPPNEVVQHLNKYFDSMIKILHENNGILDKYIGDAVMGLFGTPVESNRHADMAVKTAIEMKNKVSSINDLWKEKLEIPLRIRVGVNTGEVVVGNIGSTKRMEYTAIGDNVNLASRLEGVNKYFGTSIIISEFTYEQLQNKNLYIIRELDRITVQGKHIPVKIYEVIDFINSKDVKLNIETYVKALEFYQNKKFITALNLFKELKGDQVSEIYAKRCRDFIKSPPGDNWNNAFKVDKY